MIATCVGNYPKVAAGAYGTKVIGAITKWQQKALNDAQLEDVFREVTRAVIKEQEDAGLDLLTDGQIRWEDLVTPVARKVAGFEINGLTRFFDNNVYYRRPILRKAPKRKGPIVVEEYRFAAGCTTKPVKAVLPGPYTFVILSEDRHFKNERKFVLAMAEILNEEARALAKAGAPFIQFDEAALGFGLSAAPGRWKRGAAQAGKPNVKLAIEALNLAAKDVKATTGVSTYFGSLNGAIDALFKARVDVVGLDVVSEPRAMAALKRVKPGKALALGCVDARNTKLESVTELHALFDVVAKRVPADQLYVNPNCGLEFLPHAQALAKIRRLGEAAKSFNRSGRS